jgi:hypothetical protein
MLEIDIQTSRRTADNEAPSYELYILAVSNNPEEVDELTHRCKKTIDEFYESREKPIL